MALTNNNLEMVKAIAKNDIHAARKAAVASLAEDTSKKNAGAVEKYRKMLSGNTGLLIPNMPHDMQSFLVGEAPGGFRPEKYYLRPAENEIVRSVRRMKLVADEMAEMGIPYKNTTLLHGASGTGKTELGRYIAWSLNLPFFYVSFASTIDSLMGHTAKNIQRIFEFCSSIPCILMLDEVDCVAIRRSSGGGHGADGELERTTIAIMQELDRLPAHVTIIAATNRLDMVDEALLRRFSIKHEIKGITDTDLLNMGLYFIHATNTSKYVKHEEIERLAEESETPGQLIPELVKIIGARVYEEKKVEFEKKAKEAEGEKSDTFEVTYTWKQTVSAETEEDAIAIARNARTSGIGIRQGAYSAKRAESTGTAAL